MFSNIPIKIGIIGGIRAGKDTLAHLLYKELYNSKDFKNTFVMSFADGIHEVIQMTMPELYADGKPRKALQHIGQGMRVLNEDVWVNMLLNSDKYHEATMSQSNIIITDVRQANEAARLKAEGFTLIKVVASKEVRLQRAKQAGDNFNPDSFEHETEKSLESLPFDYMINNNGTVAELTLQIRSVIDSIREEVTPDEL